MNATSRQNREFASWYNTQYIRKWLVPRAFMGEMSCMDTQLRETAR